MKQKSKVEVVFDGGGAHDACECGSRYDLETNDEQVFLDMIAVWRLHHEDGSFSSGVWHRQAPQTDGKESTGG